MIDAQDLGRARGATLTVRGFGPDGELAPALEPFDLEACRIREDRYNFCLF